jgi:hypothetical protein
VVPYLSVKFHYLVAIIPSTQSPSYIQGPACQGRLLIGPRSAALRELLGSSRQRHAEVIVGPARGDAAAAGTLDETALQHVGLVDVLHSVARLT